jgi:uncharacterized protein YjiS (DUF1127 family)
MIMSMTIASEAREEAGGGALATAAAALKRLGAACVGWHLERSALAVLNAMSERELADIGLARAESPNAVRRGAARGRESCEL